MDVKRVYIQQLAFDGESYRKGPVIDLLSKFNIACMEFPFKIFPEAKDLPVREWPGEDGRDVYIPSKIPMKNYDLEVEFVYKGTEKTIAKDITDFIEFIYGRNAEAVGGSLAIYDEYVRLGRKDVHVLSVDNTAYSCDDIDPDAVASFKVKFGVEDPTTKATAVYTVGPNKEMVVSDLKFDK